MVKQRLIALMLFVDTLFMIAVSGDATIALLTIPMCVLLIFKKIEEETDGKEEETRFIQENGKSRNKIKQERSRCFEKLAEQRNQSMSNIVRNLIIKEYTKLS